MYMNCPYYSRPLEGLFPHAIAPDMLRGPLTTNKVGLATKHSSWHESIMVVVVVVVVVMMAGIRSADGVQGLRQNAISGRHTANRLIEQLSQIRMPFLSDLHCPLAELFTVLVIVIYPMRQQHPQLFHACFLHEMYSLIFQFVCFVPS
jgi:hypothetical protein